MGRNRYLPMVMAAIVLAPPLAHGVDVFPTGASTRATGMESPVSARDISALLYNPANLTDTTGQRPYVDMAFISASYSYEHPSFDPIVVDVATPSIALGYSHAFTNRVVIGAGLFPSNITQETVYGLPRKLGTSDVQVQVEYDQQVIDAVAGIAYPIHPQVSVGASVRHSMEKRVIRSTPEDSDTSLIYQNSYGQFNQYQVGATYTNPWVVIGTSFSPATVKPYNGERSLGDNVSDGGPGRTDYEPMNAALGTRVNIASTWVEANLKHRFWRPGSNIIDTSGIDTSTSQTTDLRDTTERGISLGYRLNQSWLASVGYAFIPSPWGDGFESQDRDPNQRRAGVDFGLIDGVDRNVYTVHTESSFDDLEGSLGIYHARGVREVTPGGDQVGYYQIAITTVGGSVSYAF